MHLISQGSENAKNAWKSYSSLIFDILLLIIEHLMEIKMATYIRCIIIHLMQLMLVCSFEFSVPKNQRFSFLCTRLNENGSHHLLWTSWNRVSHIISLYVTILIFKGFSIRKKLKLTSYEFFKSFSLSVAVLFRLHLLYVSITLISRDTLRSSLHNKRKSFHIKLTYRATCSTCRFCM